MSIDYKYDPVLNLIRTTIVGVLTTGEIAEHAKKVSKDNEIKDGFSEIVDMKSADDLVATFSDRLKLIYAFSQWKARNHTISIFYTPNKLSTEVTEFMLPLVRHAGIAVHAAKTEQKVSELMAIIKSEKETAR